MHKKPSPAAQVLTQTTGNDDEPLASSISPVARTHYSLHEQRSDVFEDVHSSTWQEILQEDHPRGCAHQIDIVAGIPGRPTSHMRLPADTATNSTFQSTSVFDSQLQPIITSDSGLSDSYTGSTRFADGTVIRWPSNHTSPVVEDWFPTPSQLMRGFELYFGHVSHFLPFLHKPTFEASCLENYLALSMLSLGFQYGEDPDCGDQNGSGAALSARCFDQGRYMIALDDEDVENVAHNIVKVQSYLMLEVCAMLYLCGKYSIHGLRMHSRMTSLARSGGLMQPAPETRTTHDLDSLWHQFVAAESHKRTSLAVHQIDALWYQFLSIPRSISHLEVKHDLPCPEECWRASSASRWAHWQLVAKSSSPPVQYSDAVRHFISSEPNLVSLPEFDSYGIINITQFLISSAREISGWSSITGRISMERLDPLKASLIAMESVIRPEEGAATSSSTALCEATWESAMIELHMWSPSHTGGIVEGSIDAVIKQLIDLAPSCEFLLETNTVSSIQPHVDWFLRYLDKTISPDTEPPWLTLYAYKAFLVAWQLIRGGITGAMQAIHVKDGDVYGALNWGQKVFSRRKRRQLGRLVLSSLELLDTSL